MTREERLDAVRAMADKLEKVAKGYRSLVWACEDPNANDALLALVEAAGRMTEMSLSQLATTLELLWEAGVRGRDGNGT